MKNQSATRVKGPDANDRLKDLEVEIRTYRANLPKLLEREGEWVLIVKDEIVDTYQAFADALKAGYHKVGQKPFLVKQIEANEGAQLITRFIDPTWR